MAGPYGFVVTGGSGFIGRALVRELAARARVLSLDRDACHFPESNVDTVECDISEALPVIPGAAGSTLIHAAAVIRSQDNTLIWRVNVEGTRNVLEYARANAVKRIVFFSTGGVYGYTEGQQKEEHPLAPIDAYGYSKLMGELLVEEYACLYGLQGAVLRLYFPYGDHQKEGIVPLISRAVREGRKLFINRGGRPVINPVHVSDVVDAVNSLLKSMRGFEVYNLCGDVCLSFTDLIDAMEGAYGGTAKRVPTDNEVLNMFGDNSKLKEHTGWCPQIPLDQETLRNTKL